MACFYVQECDTLDVVIVFLNGDFEEQVYMDLIESFEENPTRAKVYMLLKIIYKLKQASRAWQQSFYKNLQKLGFIYLQMDLAIFIQRSNGILVIILVHVDDMAIIGPSSVLIDKFKHQLTKKFEIEDNSPISSFLGLKVI